ncbi:MAG: sodium ion-translocating decarboxylase subunit beta [Chloroflexi bacterium]|nr:sodium ion-translocating decarboxylase subunit beta [Chloroflexota bacterium]
MEALQSLGILNLGWQSVVMLVIAGVMIYLGIGKKVEPYLLVPMGAGVLMANLPLSPISDIEQGGLFAVLARFGVFQFELFPLLIFIGVGAMIDFGPFLERPYTVLLGAAAQFGIFGTFLVAYLLGAGMFGWFDFSLRDAASIGIIGSADGPTSIYVSTLLGSKYAPSIIVAAYSYMALVPIIQPPVMRLLTTKEERAIRMSATHTGKISRRTRILFPILVILVVGLVAPPAIPLIGALMFGNLLRECGVLGSLANTAQTELANIVTILLGLAVGGMMTAMPQTITLTGGETIVMAGFLQPATLMVFALGIVAFALDTAGGVLFGKLLCHLSGRRINPLIGAAGISAFPMSARVVQKEGLKANKYNHLLMHAAGANTAGQIASVVAGGAVLMLISRLA